MKFGTTGNGPFGAQQQFRSVGRPLLVDAYSNSNGHNRSCAATHQPREPGVPGRALAAGDVIEIGDDGIYTCPYTLETFKIIPPHPSRITLIVRWSKITQVRRSYLTSPEDSGVSLKNVRRLCSVNSKKKKESRGGGNMKEKGFKKDKRSQSGRRARVRRCVQNSEEFFGGKEIFPNFSAHQDFRRTRH